MGGWRILGSGRTCSPLNAWGVLRQVAPQIPAWFGEPQKMTARNVTFVVRPRMPVSFQFPFKDYRPYLGVS